eukprot:GILK01002350.1.p1 GENE.GILK01002350.1~~GILK01002350.1.p1  ORF type:complete len:398 (+),score=59.85 GILK01002350.1:42-1196(+)
MALRDASRTLWIGELPPDLDDEGLKRMFQEDDYVIGIRIVLDKQTGKSAGYGFLDFPTHDAAARFLRVHEGKRMPGKQRSFNLAWTRENQSTSALIDEYQLYVSNLHPDVTDSDLRGLFGQFYPSLESAKVIADPVTSLSRGFGFVRFANDQEVNIALKEMQGALLKGQEINVRMAYLKAENTRIHDPAEATNKLVYVGNLSSLVTQDELRREFSAFGNVTDVRVIPAKNMGFVTMYDHISAVAALSQMNGAFIRGQKIRVAWGRAQRKEAAGEYSANEIVTSASVYNKSYWHSLTPQVAAPLPQEPTPMVLDVNQVDKSTVAYWLSFYGAATNTSGMASDKDRAFCHPLDIDSLNAEFTVSREQQFYQELILNSAHHYGVNNI